MAHPTATEPLPRVYWSDLMLSLADRYRKLIAAAIVAIYLLGFNGQWRPEPDAALYLSIGRNLAEGHGYTYHGEPHHLAYPGLPWLWAGVYSIAPNQAMLIDHALILLTGLASLALCYRLFKLFAGRPTAVFITLGLAVSRMFYRYCFELRSDMPFLLGVLAFLCGFEAVAYTRRRYELAKLDPFNGPPPVRWRWYDWALMFGGLALAIVMRPTMWALVAAAVVVTLRLLWIGRTRRLIGGVIVVAALTVVGVRYASPAPSATGSAFSQYEQALFDLARHRTGELAHRIWTENIPGLFEPAASEAMFGLDMGVGLNTVGSIVAIAIGLSLFRHRLLWGLLYLFTVLMMVLVLPLDRYFLAVLPLTVFGWWRFLVWVERRLPGRWGTIAFVTLFFLGSGTNFAKVARAIFDQHQRPFLAHYRDGRYEHCPEIGKAMEATLPENAWIVSPPRQERILSFYSRRNVSGAGSMSGQELQLLADVDRAFVLNPSDDEVAAWLSTTTLELGDPMIRIGDPADSGWELYPIKWKNPIRALPTTFTVTPETLSPTTSVTTAPTPTTGPTP